MFNRLFDFIKNKNKERRIETELYPDPVSSRSADDLPARARGRIVNDLNKCTGCGDCVAICPTKCISLKNGLEVRGKYEVENFSIDFSNCIFCGECVSVCEPRSLKQNLLHVGAAKQLPQMKQEQKA